MCIDSVAACVKRVSNRMATVNAQVCLFLLFGNFSKLFSLNCRNCVFARSLHVFLTVRVVACSIGKAKAESGDHACSGKQQHNTTLHNSIQPFSFVCVCLSAQTVKQARLQAQQGNSFVFVSAVAVHVSIRASSQLLHCSECANGGYQPLDGQSECLSCPSDADCSAGNDFCESSCLYLELLAAELLIDLVVVVCSLCNWIWQSGQRRVQMYAIVVSLFLALTDCCLLVVPCSVVHTGQLQQ